MIGRIILGVVVFLMGIGIVWKTRTIVDFFGHMEWAERKLGGGGTYLMYKFVGILMSFVGMLIATNLWEAFLQATVGSIFPKIPTQ
jgi:hypothetical protein